MYTLVQRMLWCEELTVVRDGNLLFMGRDGPLKKGRVSRVTFGAIL